MTQVIEDYFEKWIAKQISEHEKETAKLFPAVRLKIESS